MKKFALFVVAILLVALSPFPEKKVRAESPYLRIIDNTTPFYSNTFATTPVFFLPYSYYVKVLGESGEYYHVEYCGENNINSIDGFVPKSMLYEDDLSASYRYPSITITTSTSTVLYLDSELSSSIQYIFSGRDLNYYGSFTRDDGEIIYFVSYFNRLGYVRESDIIPFQIPLHPNPLTFIQEEEPEIEPPPQKDSQTDVTTIRIIIFVCLFFAGIFAIFVAVKNKPIKKNQTYFDEEDYE